MTKTGRWTRDEHFRFLEALKLFGKEWKHVQQHVGSRSSTQARSHAQKFFVKLQKKNKNLESFLKALDLRNIQKSLADQDVSDSGEENEDQYVPSIAAQIAIRQQCNASNCDNPEFDEPVNAQDSSNEEKLREEKPGYEI